MNAKAFTSVVAAILSIASLAVADTHYVSVASTNPVPPYTNWATAATNIQDAVDKSDDGDTVLVTNGTYLLSTEIVVTNGILLQSLAGPASTVIEIGDATRCFNLGSSPCTVSGFMITNGFSRFNVGGVYCLDSTPLVTNCLFVRITNHAGFSGMIEGTADNCVFKHNFGELGGAMALGIANNCMFISNASYSGGAMAYGIANNCMFKGNSSRNDGGGMRGGVANNCRFEKNTAVDQGGGLYGAVANNCMILSNASRAGGGMVGDQWLSATATNSVFIGNTATEYAGGMLSGFANTCTFVGNTAGLQDGGITGMWAVHNCIFYYNSTVSGQDNGGGFQVLYSCSPDLVQGQQGNINSPPLFVDTNGWANLRLQSNSPCINAGHNSLVTSTNDLDGNPRIIGVTVDMGAYENTDGSTTNGIPWLWLIHYDLPTDGSVDDLDEDNDRATTWQEWKMWTIPTNGLSVLKMLLPDSGTNGVEVAWQSVGGHTYTLERAPHVGAAYEVLQSGIPSQGDTTTFTDTTATNDGAFLYRVSVPE